MRGIRLNVSILKCLGFVASAGILAGCSKTSLPPSNESDKIYKISTHQLPPEPTYNRLRWVHLPDVVPGRELESNKAPLLKPVFQFEVKNTPLHQAAKILASTARYESYCAASVSDMKITLKRLGTIDELAEAIEQEAGIRVVVDHDSREVRFLAQQAESARFFEK